VTYYLVYATEYLMTSEGTEIRQNRSYSAIEAGLNALADDGVPLNHFYATYARTPADLPAGETGRAEILLHKHQENTAALERSIAQTGFATVYGIHFDTDSARLRGDSLPALNAVLGLVQNHSSSRWLIAGHTDNQGNDARNQPLSEQRAAAVIAWLKDHGANVSQLVPQGFGSSRPVADNATSAGRALNRRVEVAPGK